MRIKRASREEAHAQPSKVIRGYGVYRYVSAVLVRGRPPGDVDGPGHASRTRERQAAAERDLAVTRQQTELLKQTVEVALLLFGFGVVFSA